MSLAGWNVNNKYRLTIDSTKIDGDLVNFPVAIVLSSGTGTNNLDATNIFTVLGSDANRTKIAVTTTISGIEEQLFVEIEDWDTANEKASLWAKVPNVSASADTVIYFYFDVTQSGNGSYVGDTGDIPAQSVWDDYFELVMHMAQDPDNGGVGDIKDSTSNANNGQPLNFESGSLVNGVVGKAIDFPGTDEYISIPDDNTLSFGNGVSSDDPVTFEFFMNADDMTDFRLLIKRSGSAAEYYLTGDASDRLMSTYYDANTSNRIRHYTTAAVTEGSWEHYAAVYSGNESHTGINLIVGGIDLAETNNPAGSYSAMHDLGAAAAIGGDPGAGSPTYADGKIGEVRISRFARSQDWLKATTYTLNNNLLSFEDLGPVFTFSDIIPVHLSTVYGTSQQLSITTVISGGLDDYVYDAVFYDGNTDIQIGSTAGISSGSPASMSLDTPSGIDYYWYIQASSSGVTDTSSTYSFTNRFLCAGDVYVNAGPASGIPIRLYRRSTGELIGQTTSTGVVATFEIASTYNEDHYAVALYSDDATNALIYDWISPG